MKKILLITLMNIVCLTVCFSQRAIFSIKGSVIGKEEQEPLVAADVTFWQEVDSINTVEYAITDRKGFFRVKLKAGEYNVRISFLGKTPFCGRVSLLTTPVSMDAIYLENEKFVLDEVTVEETHKLVKVQPAKLVYDVQNDPDVNVATAIDILEKVPLVSLSENGEIEIDGNSDLKIYMNGKPSSLFNDNPYQVLKNMPAETIKKIEVTSTSDAKYDVEGTGGSINLIMEKKVFDGYSGTVNAEVDRFGALGGGTSLLLKTNKLGVSANYDFKADRISYSDFLSLRNTLINSISTNQIGERKSDGISHLGYVDLSYDFSDKTLLNISFDGKQNKKNTYSELSQEQTKENGDLVYSYDQSEKEKYSADSYSLSATLQQYTKKAGEYISLLYKYEYSEMNPWISIDRYNTLGGESSSLCLNSEDRTNKEHTVQVDVVSPISDDIVLEFGSKWITRKSIGLGNYAVWNENTDEWDTEVDRYSSFLQKTDILAFYSKYSFDFNEQWAVDIGARTEYTVSTIDVPNESNEVSKSKYLNFVPMFQSVYRFDEKNNFIFNYGMRISRPGLTYLNPYIDDSDPTNIYFGNPDLNIVRRDLVTLSYNHLRSKFDLYARLNYSITNNSIQPYLYYANEILNNTYMNFGKQQESGLLLYANWTPDDMLRLSLKGTIAYVDIESKQEDVLKRAGFSNRISGNIAYKLPSDFYISVSGGYYQPSIQLQTKGDPYYYSRISVSKNWLDDKLSLALSISNPISSKTKFQYLTETPDVYRQDIDYRLDQKLKDKTCVSFW